MGSLELRADTTGIYPGEEIRLTCSLRSYIPEASGMIRSMTEVIDPGLTLFANDEALSTLAELGYSAGDGFNIRFNNAGNYDLRLEGYPGEVVRLDVGNATGINPERAYK